MLVKKYLKKVNQRFMYLDIIALVCLASLNLTTQYLLEESESYTWELASYLECLSCDLINAVIITFCAHFIAKFVRE